MFTIDDFKQEREKFKIMRMFEAVRELMEYFDDGLHNEEYFQLVKISNQLIDDYERVDSV